MHKLVNENEVHVHHSVNTYTHIKSIYPDLYFMLLILFSMYRACNPMHNLLCVSSSAVHGRPLGSALIPVSDTRDNLGTHLETQGRRNRVHREVGYRGR